ncbi:G-type lectin S-receptor-like serine/threonine-protein kinase At4g27290 [Olea europaea var. sylvestris]|uniref:G-type lectin S-receptor-like serine/threonine-protein kinase At4g27290 n=1 Tax=Olea europaea var. sylvestris TaxID=158386 RepID=UPI000C1CF693|nr:G-type lectin S-receptor-like serine/threonine-protein kinase At4g27290 [Olea europaea var. sylvestris]
MWSSNSTGGTMSMSPVAQLLDSGNLVIRGSRDGNYTWQSFDHPTDTALPGLKMGKNLVTGVDRILYSRKSNNDPSRGDYMYLMDTHGYPQHMMMTGSTVRFRSGPWNGLAFSGSPGLKTNPIYTFQFVFNQEEVYYSFDLVNPHVYSRLVLDPDGVLRRFSWNNRTQVWTNLVSAPADNCDIYGQCNGYGKCTIGESPICSCLDKFKPKNPKDWLSAVWSDGCVRRTPLNCNSDGFVKYSRVKLPDTRKSWYNLSMSLKECRQMCKNNCSCMAYSNIDIRGKGSGCFLWFEDLMDIRYYDGNDGQDIYIRMASSELGSSGLRKKILRACLASLGAVLILCLILISFTWKKKKRVREKQQQVQQQLTREGSIGSSSRQFYTAENDNGDLDLPLFDVTTILEATNYFSPGNKIGEGGFGPVYKGVLRKGKEIAVKRLSKYSIQGDDEFKNEVILIAKLQHRNLVNLIGCCIHEEEKILIYEFMPNNSLDTYIFDKDRGRLLDWEKRFQIINGIARGLLYLHQDSRLRIIHRDLKAGNILLDADMNPKISDFGMARSFGGNEIEANTRRVVGTYGYMSPEYVVDGHFSVKSDIFSFGVLILEIISGQKNRGFFHQDHHHNLLGHAWILHNEGRSLELIDSHLAQSCYLSEVLRSMHVALLCVQRNPEDRPNMSNVVLMLASAGALPKPKEPGFFTERNSFLGFETSSSKPTVSSANELSFTEMEGR